METRISTNKDKEMLKELWANSFNYTEQFLDWYFDNVFTPENTLITTEFSNPIFSVSIIPQKLTVSGQEVNSAYISGIAIPPEHRNEENMKNHISATISAAAQKGYLLSTIIPTNYKFYEKYGWRVCYNYKQYDIAPSDLPEYQVRGSFVRAKITDTSITALSDIYADFTASKNAYAKRSAENWRLILEDLFSNFGGKCVVFKNQNDIPTGYILYIIRDRKMGIYEFCYKDRTAYESLIGFINAHKLNIESVAIKASADDLSHLDFCDRRDAVRLYPFAAARITNAKDALEPFAAACTESFKLQIIDRLIEENNQTFLISDGEVSRTEEPADVITDIGTLTQLFMGYISAEEARRMNLISGNSAYLDKMFCKKNNYINMLLT